MSRKPVTLYRFRLSGHSHRVELFLSLLGIPFAMVEVELGKGKHKTPNFLMKNPMGQVPVIVDGDLVLADSNAILIYLAFACDPERRWYPADPAQSAEVQHWLSVAAGPLLTGPGYARLVGIFNAKHDLARAHAAARQLFEVMDEHLRGGGGFLVGAQPTIADVALYTYTAHAPEGHISLEPYPAIRAWLRAVELLPGFVPMARTEPRFGRP
ncbi:MAG: glutathione S-transferase [Alphaproteobacteria bacterium HGW-Alphaproteobacteria-11]|nr:MAG: glutathione S-transferase [Alphaproteobacteria bacterium HGW-Alphaproteobacteria-11]